LSFYADTSALVAAFVQKPHTPRIRPWLFAQPAATVFISDWTHIEVAGALSLKVRTGELTLDLRADAMAAWHELHTASLPTLAVAPDHFETAAHFAPRHDLSLRAGDALHLAIASAGGHALVTLDTHMAEAALQLGIPVEAI
jgi:predicted nucleic acid-binding protein